MKRWLFITIFVLLLSLFSFSAGEIILRIFSPQLTFSKLLFRAGEYYAPSEFNPFTLKKNYSGSSASLMRNGTAVQIQTNSMGLRNDEINIEKSGNAKRIIVVGDSFTFGIGVNNNETYPARLGELLKADGTDVEVINCGYASGFEADHHYCWLYNETEKFKPDVIIYGLFLLNDITAIAPYAWTKLNEDSLPVIIKDEHLSVHDDGYLYSVNNTGNRAVYNPVYRIPLLRESHLLVFFSELITKHFLLPEQEIDAEGIKRFGAYGKGHELIFGASIFSEKDTVFDMKEAQLLKLVAGMKKVAEKSNAHFLVLMLPASFQLIPEYLPFDCKIKRDYYKDLSHTLDSLSINYLNLLPALQKEQEPKNFYPENKDVHLNAEGYSFTAKQLKLKLEELGWI